MCLFFSSKPKKEKVISTETLKVELSSGDHSSIIKFIKYARKEGLQFKVDSEKKRSRKKRMELKNKNEFLGKEVLFIRKDQFKQLELMLREFIYFYKNHPNSSIQIEQLS